MPSTSWDTTTISKMGPMIAEGPTNALGSKVKPTNRVKAIQSKQSRAQSETRSGSKWHFLRPHRGDPTPSSFVSESRPGGFLHAAPCGLAPSHPGFPTRDYPGKMLETIWPGFDLGGALAPIWSYGEAPALAISHPWMVTQAPLRSWLGTTVWCLRPLASSRTWGPRPLCKYQ
jgi:hypothetical protein